MFYFVSKIVWFVLQPSSVVALMMIVGFVLSGTRRWISAGRRLMFIGLTLLLIGGLSPAANLLMLPLESMVAPARLDGTSIRGIIVLGGAENGRISLARGSLTMNDAGERITGAVIMAAKFPRALVVWSGGAGQMFRAEASGASSVAAFLQVAGVAKERILIEDKSQNTAENASETKALLQPKRGERWVLVTSAFHMPRALGCFRKAGFDILPWPVDYRTKDAGDLLRPFNSIAKGLRRLDVAAKEWIGLIVYWLSGKTSALFPR